MLKFNFPILLFLLSFQTMALTEQQCRTQLAQASGLSADHFEYLCEREEKRAESREIANCFTMFKGQHLDADTYRNYCTENNGQREGRQAVFSCMRAANATRYHLEPYTTLRLCQDEAVRTQFNQVVSCVVTGTPLFSTPENSETFMWELIDVCKQGGQEAVSKVKACTSAQHAKFLQIVPEAKHEAARGPSERHNYFHHCAKSEIHNNLPAILRCQDRVGQSVRKLIDQSAAAYRERHEEPDNYYYERASTNGAEALNTCMSSTVLNSQPQEVMACVDTLAEATKNDIFQTYEANTGLLAVSIQGKYFDLHIERCATEELRQFQTEVLACMNRVGRFVPRNDQAIAGGSYIYCEMFTAANRGLQTRAPAFLPINCPDAK
ncbi:MAG: hypothetical protein HYV97_17405 [Bdellovibrio sp.]|nr:hypothetical protein [Bdellovibrio sp.]